MILLGIIVWVVCAAFATDTAVRRGQGGCAWFFLGILIGPLAVAFALIVPEKTSEIKKIGPETEMLKKCAFCAELVKPEASVCKYCGRDLPPKFG